MIVSMTGFGKALCQVNDKTLKIEIRALNSKNLDLSIKAPQQYREKENAIRNLVSATLERGKIEVILSLESQGTNSVVSLNKALLKTYYQEMKQIAEELGVGASENLFTALMRMPEIFKSESEPLDPQEWEIIERGIQDALEQLQAFRLSEGQHLQQDILLRIELIGSLSKQIETFEPKRIDNVRERLLKALSDLGENVRKDENRFEQELIYYLEKFDITEEKVRLAKHLEYFTETVKDQAAGGKKLGFITQEIGREINTIGSKANDADIQKLVVQMKDELEKIKEQLLNIL